MVNNSDFFSALNEICQRGDKRADDLADIERRLNALADMFNVPHSVIAIYGPDDKVRMWSKQQVLAELNPDCPMACASANIKYDFNCRPDRDGMSTLEDVFGPNWKE